MKNLKDSYIKSSGQAHPLLGYGLALAATAIWSFNFIVARGLSDSVPPVTLAFLRWSTAAVVLLPFGIRPFFRDYNVIRKNLGYLSLTAFLLVTVFNTLIYIAAHTSKAVTLSLIAASSPVFIVFFAYLFLKAPLSLPKIIGLVAATVGVALLVTKGDFSQVLEHGVSDGDAWMILAASIFGAYSILVRFKPKNLGAVAFLCSTLLLGLLFLVPWLLWELRAVDKLSLSSGAIAAIIYLGVGPSLVAFLCWNKAIMLIGPVHSAFVYYSLPIFSAIEGAVILGEPIHFIDLFSGALIMMGVMIATRE